MVKVKVSESDTDEKLPLELGAEIQIEIDRVAFRFKSTFVGMEPGNYLIVKTPIVPQGARFSALKNKLKRQLFTGCKIVVRYLFEGTIFAFQSLLLEAISVPGNLLFLDYPKTIQHPDLRSNERVACFLPAKGNIKDHETQGTILDISEKGCCYLIKPAKKDKLPSIYIMDQITLECEFLGDHGEQVVSGNVRNVNKDKKGTTLGVEFREIGVDIKSTIAQYVSNIKESF